MKSSGQDYFAQAPWVGGNGTGRWISSNCISPLVALGYAQSHLKLAVPSSTSRLLRDLVYSNTELITKTITQRAVELAADPAKMAQHEKEIAFGALFKLNY